MIVTRNDAELGKKVSFSFLHSAKRKKIYHFIIFLERNFLFWDLGGCLFSFLEVI